ncbi:MAG: hypothetical protein HKN22_04955 [Bacteroidia bacterium]|nr:hypothetical protein [Bacteroidia bacterium]
MRIALLVIFSLGLSIPGFAQKIAPTTEKEFNYITVGYKIQLQAGLPMKADYKFKDLGRHEVVDCIVEMKGLYRKGEEQPCAMMMIYTEVRQEPVYFCVPSPDAAEELWERYYKSLIPDLSNHQDKLRYMLYATTKFWIDQLQQQSGESTPK